MKNSCSKTKTIFEISHREWFLTQTKGENFKIYRVSGIGTADLKFCRISNQYLLWKHDKLGFSYHYNYKPIVMCDDYHVQVQLKQDLISGKTLYSRIPKLVPLKKHEGMYNTC